MQRYKEPIECDEWNFNVETRKIPALFLLFKVRDQQIHIHPPFIIMAFRRTILSRHTALYSNQATQPDDVSEHGWACHFLVLFLNRPSARRGLKFTLGRHLRSKRRCSCVLQFTRLHAVSCVLHRPTSRVIHHSRFKFLFIFLIR